MTDFTLDSAAKDRQTDSFTYGKAGFFTRQAGGATGGMFRDLYEDFRAVPVEAWIILAVATGLSNLFIALA